MKPQKYTHWFLVPTGESNLGLAALVLLGALLGASFLLIPVLVMILILSLFGIKLTGVLDVFYPWVFGITSGVLYVVMWFKQRKRLIKEFEQNAEEAKSQNLPRD